MEEFEKSKKKKEELEREDIKVKQPENKVVECFKVLLRKEEI